MINSDNTLAYFGIKKLILFHNLLLQSFFLFCFQNLLLQFLFLLKCFQTSSKSTQQQAWESSFLYFCFVFNCFRDPFQENIRIFKCLNSFHYVILFLFEIIKVFVPELCIFFWIPGSIECIIPNGAKTFFAKGIATFINWPASLLNNDPKNPPDWIILEIWALGSFMSVDILILSAFLSFVVLLSIIIHEADLFH